ncbi:MAG TPA: SAM-dependent methyltransferase [Trebonia sp.]|nr:SAM-dependent methyltransferase [Trebonia sp.]
MSRQGRPWTLPGPRRVPPQVDIHQPSAARVYDAILGGKDNFPWDRAVAAEVVAVFPQAAASAILNRQVLERAIRYLDARGIDQFLDIGSGLPTVRNTHEIAQELNPRALVAYVDNDPIVLTHARAQLVGDAATTVVTADLRHPDTILNSPAITAFLDFSRPVGLVLNGVVHHLGDDDDPQGVVTKLTSALAPGSYLQLTHFSTAGPAAAALERVLMRSLGSGRLRSRDEITAFFDGLELVDPGVVFLPDWRPDGPVSHPLEIGGQLLLGGMARKP